jgi:hypothetical protein
LKSGKRKKAREQERRGWVGREVRDGGRDGGGKEEGDERGYVTDSQQRKRWRVGKQ